MTSAPDDGLVEGKTLSAGKRHCRNSSAPPAEALGKPELTASQSETGSLLGYQ